MRYFFRIHTESDKGYWGEFPDLEKLTSGTQGESIYELKKNACELVNLLIDGDRQTPKPKYKPRASECGFWVRIEAIADKGMKNKEPECTTCEAASGECNYGCLYDELPDLLNDELPAFNKLLGKNDKIQDVDLSFARTVATIGNKMEESTNPEVKGCAKELLDVVDKYIQEQINIRKG